MPPKTKPWKYKNACDRESNFSTPWSDPAQNN